MKKLMVIVCLAIIPLIKSVAQEVLIVADEIPAMGVLATALKKHESIDSRIITQTELPVSLSGFRAVIVYIHKDLDTNAENAFISYAKNGGKLILLHHSISSAKRKNQNWFSFLGVELPGQSVEEGGYKYVGGIDMEVVNLAPGHFITTNKIKYGNQIAYQKEGRTQARRLEGFTLSNTEAFLNHQLKSPRTILLGFSFIDKAGKRWSQDRSAWYMPVEKGLIFYSQPGHAVTDFEGEVYTRIVANMVVFGK